KFLLTRSKKLSYSILITTFISSSLGRGLYYLIYEASPVVYDYMIVLVESSLSVFLVMVFMQSFPYLMRQEPVVRVKIEEIICIVILITAVLTGFFGINFLGIGLEQVGSKYFILISAFISGATVGSAIGVIVGLMLSLVST